MATSMRRGGSEHQVALLARHLPRDCFEVHCYLTHRDGELLGELPSDVPIHSASPTPDRPSLRDRVPGTMLRRQAAQFAELVRREKIDVIYDRAFHNTMIAGHPSVQHLVARRVSTIVSPPHEAVPMVEKRFLWAKRRLLAAAYHRSDRIIAVSHAAADSAASYYGLSRDRIEVIYNPVDDAGFPQHGQTDRQPEFSEHASPTASPASPLQPASPLRPANPLPLARPLPPARPLRLVCVGRMTPEKGQSDLIAAVGRLSGQWPVHWPRLHLRLIGDGPDRPNLERQWRSLAGESGLLDGHRIEFAGIVSPAISEIASADALVLPSRFEGLPNVVLESFAVGTPVLATRSGGTPELQPEPSEPTCFWAEPGDPDSIAAGLRELVSRPELRRRHARTALTLVRSRHSVAIAIEKIAAILRA